MEILTTSKWVLAAVQRCLSVKQHNSLFHVFLPSYLLFKAANISLSLGFLLYASWSDYKTREVSNRVWIIYAPIALSLALADFLIYDPFLRLPSYGISFGVTAVIAIVLFYSGAFGGADSKALMCIALALPFSTETLFSPIVSGGVSPLSLNLFPLTVFSNG